MNGAGLGPDAPMPDPELAVEAALREEREFVLTLGGFALEFPGGTLVTNERVPVPRFNFVQDVRVGAERQTAFFERALDHYFQRALRPTFRVAPPVPPHVDAALRRFGFRPRDDPRTLFLEGDPTSHPSPSTAYEVREANPEELDSVLRFWVGPTEEVEFRRALEVAWTHPNPDESLAPWVAAVRGTPVAVALAYRWRSMYGIHGVATAPSARGQGAASALVLGICRGAARTRRALTSIESDSARLNQRLPALGFVRSATWTVYELPGEAQLTLPDPGPPQPPRWRPPRSAPC